MNISNVSIDYRTTKKVNLLDLNRKQMRIFFEEIGEKPFRAHQVMKWIYNNYCNNFDEMKNLNKTLREKLKEVSEIRILKIAKEQRSSDGTIKWEVSISNQSIETVYIPEKNRATLCVSSQMGCSLKCKFCFTAKQGFNRNLRVSEIISQVWIAKKIISLKNKNKINVNMKPITNIVIMGMGEPLLNLKNIVLALEIMIDKFGFSFSKRRITLSTSGIVPAIKKLGNMVDVGLAISLHAPNDEIRNRIMPINKKYNIESLITSINKYLEKVKHKRKYVTIEYVMLKHINDGIEHAHQLAKLLKNVPCKINLIPWNSFPRSEYNCSSNNHIFRFYKILKEYNFSVFIRKIRGSDINAACGQLSGSIIDRMKNTFSKNKIK